MSARSSGRPTLGDRIAAPARWGNGPRGAAHNFVSLDAHHDDFSRMLNQLNSYQSLIHARPMGGR